MEEFPREELEQAIKTFRSSISKCEKARTKLKDGSPQKKWVDRQLRAYSMTVPLIENALGEERKKAQYTQPERQDAAETYTLLIGMCEKLLMKFRDGSPQKTLALRRLNAFRTAAALITRES